MIPLEETVPNNLVFRLYKWLKNNKERKQNGKL